MSKMGLFDQIPQNRKKKRPSRPAPMRAMPVLPGRVEKPRRTAVMVRL
jgi:hypothetical protein